LCTADNFNSFWEALVEEVARSNILCGDSIEESLRRAKLDGVPLLSVRGHAARGSSWSRISEQLESSIPYNLRRSD